MHKQTMKWSPRWIIATAAAALLVGCGADQLAGIQGSGAPAPASVTVVGPVTGFGSIFVDGVEYTTSGAQIRVDDQPGTEAQLRVGQIVTLRGTLKSSGTTGTASDVQFTSDLRGPVQNVDLDARTFTVLGQTVRVTDATLFDDGIQLAGIQGSGLSVQVSGFTSSTGEIVASRVDPTSSTTLQLRGAVRELDTTARTFRINTLTVDYSGVEPIGTLANASVVTVQGNAVSQAGVLTATRVQVFAGLGAAANDSGRIEGVITSFVSNADFMVNGQRVSTDSSTQFMLQGVTLGLNVAVKVRGTFNASGVLVATRVEAKAQTLSVVRGLVDSVSASTNTLTVLGVAVTTVASTTFEDRAAQPLRSFQLSDVRTGDYVEVRGNANAGGNGLVASLVQRRQAEARSYLQGMITSVANPNFTVLGLTVATDSQTQFVGAGAPAVAAAEFFSQAPNQLVIVRGTLNGNVLLAEQAQLRP
jgi:hypothetical protein